jgi:hypothetical protein
MASKQDKFIENLKSFSSALENITEALKEQQKAGSADIMVDLVSKFDEKLNSITKGLQEVVKNTASIESKADKILKVTEDIRKGKEGGVFEKAYDKKAKSKIMDGVKTIVLIAGAVLAIGLAFKVVGHVDFASVLSLGIAMIAVAYAFQKISEVKGLTPKKALVTGLSIVIMSAAIYASALILSHTPHMNLMQGLTIILVSAAIGLAAFLIFKGIEHLNLAHNMATILLLPLILPLISLGIVWSSNILKNVTPLKFDQIIAVIGVSAALIPAAIATFFIGKALQGMSIGQMITTCASMSIISLAIVAASWILKLVSPIKTPWELIKTSFTIALSTIMFVPAMMILGKMNIMQLLMGGAGIIIASVAIMATSWILSIGKYDGAYPDWKWSLGVGLAMIMFAPALLILGALMFIGIAMIACGAISALIVAATIVGVAEILSKGNFATYPSIGWSASVGLAMLAFAIPMLVLGTFVLVTFGLGMIAIHKGAEAMKIVAQTIVDCAAILAKGKYEGGPTKEWSEGVGNAIAGFSGAFAIMKGGLFTKSMSAEEFSNAMKTVALGLVGAAQALNSDTSIDWSKTKYPTREWSEGVANAIGGFSEAFKVINDSGGFLRHKMTPEEFSTAMSTIAAGLIGAAKVLNADTTINWNSVKYPTKEWAENVGAALTSFSDAIQKIGDIDNETFDNIDTLLIKMMEVHHVIKYLDLQKSMYGKGGVVYNFGESIKFLVGAFPNSDQIDPIERFINALKEIDDISFGSVFTVLILSNAIGHLSDTLDNIDTGNIEKLLKISAGFKMISLIDNVKLADAIRTVNEKKEEIAEIFDDKTFAFSIDDYLGKYINKQEKQSPNVEKTTAGAANKTQDENMKKLLDFVGNIDKNIESISKIEEKNPLNKPENVHK